MSLDEKLARFSKEVVSERMVLRAKTFALIRRFNSGSTTINRWGFSFDIANELEAMLARLSDDDCREALRILRE